MHLEEDGGACIYSPTANLGCCDRGLREKQRLGVVGVSSLPLFSNTCFWDRLVKPGAKAFKGHSLSWISEEHKRCSPGDLQPLVFRVWRNTWQILPRRAALQQAARCLEQKVCSFGYRLLATGQVGRPRSFIVWVISFDCWKGLASPLSRSPTPGALCKSSSKNLPSAWLAEAVPAPGQ